MSRQNKVNPGQYTQRGRLTQDDAARELRQQRSIGSEHTWQPVQKDQMPRPRVGLKDNDADRNEETSEDKDDPAARPATSKRSAGAASKRTTAKAKTTRAAKPAAKVKATKTARKAVLARNVGGGGSKPRQAAKRRKS